MKWTDYYWLGWLSVIFGLFFPVELWAFWTRQHDKTFSDTMWRWTNHTWPHVLLIIFMVWLTGHLCWRWSVLMK